MNRAFIDATDDYESLLEVIVHRTVGVVGDYCGVSMVSEDGEWLDPVTYFDRDPQVLAAVRQVWKRASLQISDQHPITEVLRTGDQMVLRQVDLESFVARMSPAFRDLVRAIDIRSLVFMPLRARRQTVGVLSIVRRGPDAELLDDLDVDVARALADQAGLAIAKARLSAEAQRELAERRRAEETLRKTREQLLHAQKMDAVGRLAGSIAHDFNNLLSVVLSYSALMLEDLAQDDPLRSDVEAIQEASDRAAALTRQLLAFSRQQVIEAEVLDLGGAVRRMSPMLRTLLGVDVDLVIRAAPGLRLVKADPGQVEQVIMNLALNARDAMPRGGKLLIEVSNVDLDQAFEHTHVGATAGPHVMLSVTDEGSGMDKEVQARLFEPFFTTKPKGKGTGLGLSTVFGIVRQSGGVIWVESELGVGTTVRVYMPESPVERVARRPSISATMSLEGDETIVLAEDEDHVRAVAHHILERYGYRVLDARSAEEALALCHQHEGRIHLLVTDVVMPDQSGRDLALQVLEVRPEVRVLYMSGYTENAIVNHGIIDRGLAYLQKPFTPELLARRVREVLDVAQA